MKPKHVAVAATVVYIAVLAYSGILISRYNRAASLRQAGYVAANRGDYAGAARAYGESVRLSPTSADAHYELARALRHLGKLDPAAAQLRQAVALREGFTAAHSELAEVLAERGSLDAAIAEYHRAISLEPNMAVHRIGIARALERNGDRSAAILSLRDGVAVEPDDAAAQVALGQMLAAHGDPDAVSVLRGAVHHFPGYAPAVKALAEAEGKGVARHAR